MSLNAENYEDIIPWCTKELKEDQSSYCLEARLMRATFFFLSGDTEKSLADLKLLMSEDVDKKVSSLIILNFAVYTCIPIHQHLFLSVIIMSPLRTKGDILF
jgi:predicted negative regulator of RcsB-dependent stress response